MTVSGHLRYTYIGNSMSTKNKKYVIAGFKDLNRNGQHNAIVIDGGEKNYFPILEITLEDE